ncbi:MAG: hypothetical protein RL139_1192 [Gemmatimonadota bacterium]|jgi:hypothetical protein
MASMTERYRRDGTVAARSLYRTGLTTADALTTLETPLSSGALLRNLVGRPTLAVAVEFTTASDDVQILVLIYDRSNGTDVLLGAQKATATADGTARRTASGKYISAPLLFDTLGGTHYEVRLYDNPAAAVDIRAWEY